MRLWIIVGLLFLSLFAFTGCSMLASPNIYIVGSMNGSSSNVVSCPPGAYCEIPAYTNTIAYLNLSSVDNVPVMNIYQ